MFATPTTQATLFPLYLYPTVLPGTIPGIDKPAHLARSRQPNLSPSFIAAISNKLKLSFIPDGQGDLATTFGPEDTFYYAYAVFHSPTYHVRYAEFLKTDFPRLPLTSDIALFADLVRLGKELVTLHLSHTPTGKSVTTFPVSGTMQHASPLVPFLVPMVHSHREKS